MSMTKGEREDLQRLIKQREKVLKSRARQRSAELIADFENQMGQEYFNDQDPVWAQVVAEAEREAKKAKAKIHARCRELGIPDQFAPSLGLHWQHRGYGNSLKQRRDELRTMAQTQVEAIERKAVTEIEFSCLHAQEQLALAGLTSDAAHAFISKLPSVEAMMPRLSVAELAGEADPPVAEQLVSPNTLRQRRFRERQAALRSNATAALGNASRNGDESDDEEDSCATSTS